MLPIVFVGAVSGGVVEIIIEEKGFRRKRKKPHSI